MAIHIHHHPYTGLLSQLSAHLPQSGPLLRRIQHEANSATPSPTARVLASFPAGENEDLAIEHAEPWIAAYVDVHRGPDTQVWVFSSLETRSPAPSTSTPTGHTIQNGKGNANITEHQKQITKAHLLTLFTFIRTDLVPGYLDMLSSQPIAAHKESEEGVKKIPPHPLASVLLGSVHESTVRLIVELAAEEKTLRVHRGQNIFYAKYCFPSSSFEHSVHGSDKLRAKESAYTFADCKGVYGVQEHHVRLVKARTNIPRSKEALMAMGGVALYHRPQEASPTASISASANGNCDGNGEGEGEMPIAWAFLGFDGSMCSLHVEPEHRGRGLAVLVGREVMKRGVGEFGSSYDFAQIKSISNGNGNGNDAATLCSNGGNGVSEDIGKSEAEHTSASSFNGSTGAAPAPAPAADQDRQEWFFADVAVENTPSRRVMEKMGGEAKWNVAWVVVEVDI
ncbi:uncharacterized protein DSM5745_02038 [Aspergillus mulundensis]|uniref:N-acetyltransferase domain-containing protein n=1 Tax=Aspergillus mulundensis TaxID=1810919 RepID=A0A3D8SVB8_9EURO|nr:hypothetical protein DSM5745_02038 [Aspergillus mulundensis]RDW90263.1 hypothetical protein DSM5745_02038 [Aspergillus mulundensis]